MKIIDAHTHPCTWPIVRKRMMEHPDLTDPTAFEEVVQNAPEAKQNFFPLLYEQEPVDLSDMLIAHMDSAGIDKAVALSMMWRMPIEFMASMVKRHPDRLYGFVKWENGIKGETAATHVETAIKNHGLHGIGEVGLVEFKPVPAEELHRHPDFAPILRVAADLQVPILFHTGPGTLTGRLAYYDPGVIGRMAAEFPSVPMIIGHAGKADKVFFENAINAAAGLDNVLIELSHNPAELIGKALRRLGARKCIWGTDWLCLGPMPDNYYEEPLRALQGLRLSADDQEWLLSKSFLSIVGSSLTK